MLCTCQQHWVSTNMFTLSCAPWVHLTKTYDITIQRYRKSHTKTEVSKMHILWCMGSKFCVNFKGVLWNFTQNFEPIHHKICISEMGPKSPCHDWLGKKWNSKHHWREWSDRKHKGAPGQRSQEPSSETIVEWVEYLSEIPQRLRGNIFLCYGICQHSDDHWNSCLKTFTSMSWNICATYIFREIFNILSIH